MVNRGWVIASIIGFLAIATFPFYWSLIGQDEPLPELLLPAGGKKCVESKQFMRADHMRLLHAWRTAVVRDQMLIYTAMDGVKYRMNLRDTCMGCHKNKEHFCDRCHEYSNITPPCWECHVAPPPLAGKKTSQIEKETSHTNSRARRKDAEAQSHKSTRTHFFRRIIHSHAGAWERGERRESKPLNPEP